MNELFEAPPARPNAIQEKVFQFSQEATRGKRQTIPWTMLILLEELLAFC